AVCVIAIRGTRNVLVSASDDSGVDAGATLKAVTAAEGGRGGGSPRLAQGAFPDNDAFAHALSTLGA
ncbi:MAG: DHHA1 domain-containing protein, partial [Gemmatimonadaceae bacterium]